jgi:hypothetical protein
MHYEAPLDLLEKQKRLQSFVESLDQWKEEADQSSIPPHIQVLISTPVRDLNTCFFPPRVVNGSSIMEVLQLFQTSRTVIVSRDPDDIGGTGEALSEFILSRLTFLQHAVSAPLLSAPLSSLMDPIPTLGWVDARETLDIVLQLMLLTGFEEVGVMDGGIVAGVLHVDDVFAFLSKELPYACPGVVHKTLHSEEGEVEEDSLLAETRCQSMYFHVWVGNDGGWGWGLGFNVSFLVRVLLTVPAIVEEF